MSKMKKILLERTSREALNGPIDQFERWLASDEAETREVWTTGIRKALHELADEKGWEFVDDSVCVLNEPDKKHFWTGMYL